MAPKEENLKNTIPCQKSGRNCMAVVNFPKIFLFYSINFPKANSNFYQVLEDLFFTKKGAKLEIFQYFQKAELLILEGQNSE